MGAANVLSFFGEKSNCLVIFGFWAKVTNFWQKNSGNLLKLLFTCPQQNLEKKWWKWFLLMTSFLGLWVSFSDFVKEISQVCRNSNLSVHMKIVIKKTLEQLVFSSFFGLWQKNLCFYRKVFGNVVKTTFYVSRGKLTEQHFWKEVLKTSGLSDNFWSFRDNGGEIFQGWQSSKSCPREQLMEKVFLKTEKFVFFSDSERFSTSSENFR